MAHYSLGSRRAAQTIRPVSLSEQVKKILRHRLVLLVSITVCALLAAAMSLLGDTKYEARSTVVVYALTPDPNAQLSSQVKVDINTEAAVAGSRQVAEVAATNIDPSDPHLVSTLRGSVEVAAHSGTAVFDVRATASSAEDAAAYANAVAKAYLEVRQQNLKEEVDKTAEAIRERISLADTSDSSARNALQERLAQVETTSTTAGRVVTLAQAPQQATSLSLWKYLLVGIVAGGLIGAVLAWMIDTRSRTVSYRDRAADLLETEVYNLRANHELEDMRRALRTLGLGRAETATVENRPGIATLQQASLYATGSAAARRLNHLLQQAAPTAHITALAPDSEISDILTAADTSGTAIIGITPATPMSQLKELGQFAETSTAEFLYLYLNH